MSALPCPICATNAQDQTKAGDDGKSVDCRRCGKFSITGTAMAMWSRADERKIANASGWIREHQGVTLSSETIDFLKSIKTPSISERAEKILRHMLQESDDLSSSHIIESQIVNEWHGVSYSVNSPELSYLLIDYLKDELGFISVQGGVFVDGTYSYEVSITPKGYAYLDSLPNQT